MTDAVIVDAVEGKLVTTSSGTYDGYGRIEDEDIDYEQGAPLLHLACFEALPDTAVIFAERESLHAGDQGFFFDEGTYDYDAPEAGTEQALAFFATGIVREAVDAVRAYVLRGDEVALPAYLLDVRGRLDAIGAMSHADAYVRTRPDQLCYDCDNFGQLLEQLTRHQSARHPNPPEDPT